MASEDQSVSFYLFDLDDNTLFLTTPIFIRNTKTGEEKTLNTHEFASVRTKLGVEEPWLDYETFEGTYSHFRDIPADELVDGQKQYLEDDIAKAIKGDPEKWQAPSWPLFVSACRRQRPLAIVTARGHSRETIKAGVHVLFEAGLIDKEPNYFAIYAVGNPETAEELISNLDDPDEQKRLREMKDPTSSLKRIAIRNAVETALDQYGREPAHRFGMSDDDPKNVSLIIKAMCDCKKKYLDKRFFVIDTHAGEMVKLEVFPVDYPVTGRDEEDEAYQ